MGDVEAQQTRLSDPRVVIAVLALAFAAASAIGLAIREAFDSRFAGAVAFGAAVTPFRGGPRKGCRSSWMTRTRFRSIVS